MGLRKTAQEETAEAMKFFMPGAGWRSRLLVALVLCALSVRAPRKGWTGYTDSNSVPRDESFFIGQFR